MLFDFVLTAEDHLILWLPLDLALIAFAVAFAARIAWNLAGVASDAVGDWMFGWRSETDESEADE